MNQWEIQVSPAWSRWWLLVKSKIPVQQSNIEWVNQSVSQWRCYALSASKVIFRARTYTVITCSVRWWWSKNDTSRRPTTGTRCPTLFDTGSIICLVAETRLDIPRPLITQSWASDQTGYEDCPEDGLRCRQGVKPALNLNFRTEDKVGEKLGRQSIFVFASYFYWQSKFSRYPKI